MVLRPEEQVKIRKMVPASTSHALTCALGYALTWALLSPALRVAPAALRAQRHEAANRAVAAAQAAFMSAGAARALMLSLIHI